jgi:hypothetical protein
MATLNASDRQTVGCSVDRRREPRDVVSVRARLKSLDPVTSVGPSTVVQVIEISRHGLKVFVHRLIVPNSLVQVTMFHDVITGKVRHCTQAAGGFHVGIDRTKLSL